MASAMPLAMSMSVEAALHPAPFPLREGGLEESGEGCDGT